MNDPIDCKTPVNIEADENETDTRKPPSSLTSVQNGFNVIPDDPIINTATQEVVTCFTVTDNPFSIQ